MGNSKSIWLDEALRFQISNQSFAGILTSLKNDTGPPFYYMLLSIWIWIFGISELAIRSLSVLFYVATLFPIYFLARSLFCSKRAGYLCSFLYIISPLTLSH